MVWSRLAVAAVAVVFSSACTPKPQGAYTVEFHGPSDRKLITLLDQGYAQAATDWSRFTGQRPRPSLQTPIHLVTSRAERPAHLAEHVDFSVSGYRACGDILHYEPYTPPEDPDARKGIDKLYGAIADAFGDPPANRKAIAVPEVVPLEKALPMRARSDFLRAFEADLNPKAPAWLVEGLLTAVADLMQPAVAGSLASLYREGFVFRVDGSHATQGAVDPYRCGAREPLALCGGSPWVPWTLRFIQKTYGPDKVLRVLRSAKTPRDLALLSFDEGAPEERLQRFNGDFDRALQAEFGSVH